VPKEIDPFKETSWEKRPKNKKDLLTGVGGMVVTVPLDPAAAMLSNLQPNEEGLASARQVVERVERLAESDGIYIPRSRIKKAVIGAARTMKARSKLETWADQVRDELGDVAVQSSATGPIMITLTCEEGQHVMEWTSSNRIPAEAIASKLKRAGWTLGRHIRCPDHAHPRKEKRKGDNVVELVTKEKQSVAASDAARTAKRLVILALDESFNTEKGCYRQGVSDATIAKELGIAEETVVRLREEFCGPLKAPSEIEELQKQIDEIRSTTLKKINEAAASCDEKCGKLERHLQALITKNKWKDA
jgi:hypothetical protein